DSLSPSLRHQNETSHPPTIVTPTRAEARPCGMPSPGTRLPVSIRQASFRLCITRWNVSHTQHMGLPLTHLFRHGASMAMTINKTCRHRPHVLAYRCQSCDFSSRISKG
ncbi:hypothetical protein BC936DRAFT_147199, partial [Jimgerdemannia flammicorona]